MPNLYAIVGSQGSEWTGSFQIQNDDGTLADLTTKTVTFVARYSANDKASPPPVEVTSVASTSQGVITVDLTTSTVQVFVSATATNWPGGTYALWMNPGLNDAEALAQGPFLLQETPTP